MPNWYAYGEDSLTYWALQNHLEDILTQLEDNSKPDNVTIFYRPSFGRGGHGDVNGLSANFGEFDAIIATPKRIYPIEAKWYRSSGVRGTTIPIEDLQVNRHKIFEWYLKQYNKCGSPSWEKFVEECDSDFRKKFPEKKLATHDSKLAKNTEFILSELISSRTEIVVTNVLLYFYPKHLPAAKSIKSVSCDLFSLVNILFTPQCSSDIFSL